MSNSGFTGMRKKASQGAMNGMRMVIYRDERNYLDEKIGFLSGGKILTGRKRWIYRDER
jgi:hypothetical protein